MDEVLQGHGTANNGNVTRTCFSDPEKFANALGLDKLFVQHIAKNLLIFCIKLGHVALAMPCHDTYDMFFRLYPWARLNPTMHKLLIHGCEIAKLSNNNTEIRKQKKRKMINLKITQYYK